MIDYRILISLGTLTCALAGNWAVMRYITKKNCSRLTKHDTRIGDIEINIAKISTTVKERIPKDLAERLGRIEKHLEQINHG